MAAGSGWTPAVGWQGTGGVEVEEQEELERAESTYSGSGAEEGQVKVSSATSDNTVLLYVPYCACLQRPVTLAAV